MRKYFGIFLLTAVGILGILTYYSNYELRLVPNKPHLRPEESIPSPKELKKDFELRGGSERDNRGFPQRKNVDLSSMFPGLFFREGPKETKQVALSFDDGPDSQYTPQILDILSKNSVRATFFLIGNRAQILPEVVKRMVNEGHIFGNHSMTHPNIIKLDKAETAKEVNDAEAALASIAGYKPLLFRSPYGSLTPEKVQEIEKLGVKIIAWNVDSLDWKSLTAEQVKTNILENVKAGSIILQHCSGSREENLTGSVTALNDVIVTLKKEGYKFVTIPELLGIPYKKAECGYKAKPAAEKGGL
jgi:peptidoglycan/xylan/chitin deacetylase (PgdA/CDA1 family)